MNKDEYLRELNRIELINKAIELSKKNNVDVYDDAYEYLRHTFFDMQDKGTKDIAYYTQLLYYERYLLEKYYKRQSYRYYWDLRDKDNPHFKNDGEEIVEGMQRVINKRLTEAYGMNINTFIYNLTDYEINKYNEDKRPYGQRISYARAYHEMNTIIDALW